MNLLFLLIESKNGYPASNILTSYKVFLSTESSKMKGIRMKSSIYRTRTSKNKQILMMLAITISLFHVFGYAQQTKQITFDKKKTIIDVCNKIETIYPDRKLGKAISDSIQTNLSKYNNINHPVNFADILKNDIIKYSHDVHFNLEYDPDLAKRMKEDWDNICTSSDKSWTEKQVKKHRPSNYGFKELKILDGNLGYLKLDVFFSPKYAGNIAEASMNFFSNCDGLIIDLRNNIGGWDEMGMLLLSYFVNDDEQKTMDIVHSTFDNIYHTSVLYCYTSGHKHPDIPIYLLVSKKSASAAEGFAYRMKFFNRATIIGEKTAGAETPVEPIPINDFILQIPCYETIYTIKGPGWQGIGVQPDIEIDAENALQNAHKEFISMKYHNTQDTIQKFKYSWLLEAIESKLNPTPEEDKNYKKFLGTYGKRKIFMKNDLLYYQNADGPEFELVQMTKELFQFKITKTIRVKFLIEKKSVKGLNIHYDDGYITKTNWRDLY